MGEIKIGTCGYSYFNLEKDWKDKYESKLQAFSNSFETIELKRTFSR